MVKYLLFRTKGDRSKLRDNIESAIYHVGLSRRLESLKFEGGKSKEFYLGIGVNLEDLEQKRLSYLLEDFLKEIDLMGYRLIPMRDMGGSYFFDEKKISGDFLKENFEYDTFLDPIRFEPITEAPEIDLSGEDLLESEGNAVFGDSASMDRLLWWMSAKGETSMQAFRDAISLLFPNNAITYAGPWGIMRKLILLGYVEIDDDGRWGMVPTTAVRTVAAGFFLTGKITPRVVRLLDGHKESSSNGGPTRIGFASAPMLTGVAVIDEPASAIANVLPDFGAWLDGLRGEPDIEPHWYKMKLYDGRRFNDYRDGAIRPGFYEVERLEGGARPRRVLFDGHRWIGGGYYDLRWSAKKIGGSAMEVCLDSEGRLFIPEADRWPMLYERPLVLSSGKLPEMKNIGGQSVLAYEFVGKGLALDLTAKLGIKMKEV